MIKLEIIEIMMKLFESAGKVNLDLAKMSQRRKFEFLEQKYRKKLMKILKKT